MPGYYDPSSTYGSPTDYSTTPVVAGPGGYLANNPEAAYARWLAGFSADGDDPFSKYAQGQFSRIYNTGFKPALATNPSLLFQNYLGQILTPAQLRQRFMHQAPQLRGINVGNFGGGKTRWSIN